MFNMFMVMLISTLVFTIILFITRIHKFSFIKKMNNQLLSWFISIIPVILIFLFFNYVNALVIILHYLIILGIIHLLYIVIKKILKKELSYNILGFKRLRASQLFIISSRVVSSSTKSPVITTISLSI